MKTITKKIILCGSFGVGKTSLISRFVFQSFSATYKTTLGVKIDRKTIQLNEDLSVSMIIWDIGGEQTQQRIPESYYLGSSGAIYVFDVSRPSAFIQIETDLEILKHKLHQSPVVVVGNKTDLLDETSLEEIKHIIPVSTHFFTSAKTGIHVEKVFYSLAEQFIHDPS